MNLNKAMKYLRESKIVKEDTDRNSIQEVSNDRLQEIIEDPKKDSNYGSFYSKEGNLYVGVDNTTGDAWTEEFKDKDNLIKWLKREIEKDDIKEAKLTEDEIFFPLSEKDQEKYYKETRKDSNGTFYDVYEIAGDLYDITGNEIKEAKKPLTELRHVDKKIIVKGYDFSELNKELQERLIRVWNKNNPGKMDNSISNISDLIKRNGFTELNSKLKELKVMIPNWWGLFDKDKEVENFRCFADRELIPTLSNKLEVTNEYASSRDLTGFVGKVSYETPFTSAVLNVLREDTNYTELEKSDKKEIVSKLNKISDEAYKAYKEIYNKVYNQLKDNSKSIEDLDKMKNKPAIDDLSQYWYTEKGEKIIAKKEAKVVEGEVNEALITEAPVSLELDQGYDVYSYDDLDDYGKERAFNNTERARRNEYDKKSNELREKIKQLIKDTVNPLGLEITNDRIDIEITHKDLLLSVTFPFTSESIIKYAKNNGIELKNMEADTEKGYPYATAEIVLSGYRHGLMLHLSVDSNNEDDKGRKALYDELTMDLEGLYGKIKRINDNFKKSIDDDFKNRLSNDRKYKRKEYDEFGNVYKDKKNEE